MASDKALVPIQTKGSQTPLFWVHGAKSLPFLQHHLPPDQPIYWLKDYWLEGSLPEDSTIGQVAASHIEEIRTVQRQGPYLLGGYSLGGLIAFEMARQLQQQGDEVGLLFLLDPNLPPQSYMDHLRRKFTFISLQFAGLDFGGRVRYIWSRIKYHWQRAVAKIVSGIYLRLGYPAPAKIVHTYHEHIYRRYIRKYVLQPYAGKATVWTTQTPEKTRRAWRVWILGGLDIHEIVGSHLNLCQEPHIQRWVLHLQKCLEQWQAHRVSGAT